MKVIFIGFSKCGTKTMAMAFKQLGYKTYDFDENTFYLFDEWTKVLNEGATKEDWLKMYSDVDAATDIPVYGFWEEILEAFPDMKMIVHYRDEEKWLKSIKNQLKEIGDDYNIKVLSMLSPSCQRFVKFGRLCSAKFFGGDRNSWPWEWFKDLNITLLTAAYRRHNNYIQHKAPKDQLLVVTFEEGWEPICKFLGKPIPDVPFPHENKNASVLKNYMAQSPVFQQMKKELRYTIPSIIAIFACCLYFIIHFMF